MSLKSGSQASGVRNESDEWKSGAHDALKALSNELQFGGHHFVVEADIKGFFDNIQWEWLERMLEQRIADGAFLNLIRKWLRAGILEEDGKVIHPLTGTPQGGVISPVLANIYLHYALDLWFERVVRPQQQGRCRLIRYADDFVVCFEYRHEAEAFEKRLKERLAKFGLEVAVDKTKTLRFGHNGGLHKWLNRRSQRQSVTWPAFNRMLVHFQVPRPRIVEKYKMGMPCQKELSIYQRLQDFRRPGTILMAHPRASWLEEPCAGIPPAGICEGGAGQPASLPRKICTQSRK